MITFENYLPGLVEKLSKIPNTNESKKTIEIACQLLDTLYTIALNKCITDFDEEDLENTLFPIYMIDK